ncbi:MAG TPA: hypothetical protein DEP53_11125, partial [Bacteroidetes bacterium]|nr:hypothetical protein [Bacteroidota bacterium]
MGRFKKNDFVPWCLRGESFYLALAMDPGSLIIISILVFLVAVLYSSVGHGGASGYLAVLSL